MNKHLSLRKSILNFSILGVISLGLTACQGGDGSDDSRTIKDRGPRDVLVSSPSPDTDKASPSSSDTPSDEDVTPAANSHPVFVSPVQQDSADSSDPEAIVNLVNQSAPLDSCNDNTQTKCLVTLVKTAPADSQNTTDNKVVNSQTEDSSHSTPPHQDGETPTNGADAEATDTAISDCGDSTVCKVDQYLQDKKTFKNVFAKEGTRRVDLLFVVDTKLDLQPVRQQVARDFEPFLREMSDEVSLHVALLAAHSKAENSLHGILYNSEEEGSTQTHPKVLRMGSANSDELTKEELLTELERHMKLITPDPSPLAKNSSQLGISSLDSLLDESSVKQYRRNGFFRPFSTLVIVFISNQGDGCYQPNETEIESHKLSNSFQQRMLFSKNRPSCVGVTPEKTIKRLAELQNGMPLIINGILHTSSEGLGQNQSYGFGYDQLIASTHPANQLTASIAKRSSQAGESDGGYKKFFRILGQNTAAEMNGMEHLSLEVSGAPPKHVAVQMEQEILEPGTYQFRKSSSKNQYWISILPPVGVDSPQDITVHY